MQCFTESIASERENATKWIKGSCSSRTVIDDFVFLERCLLASFWFSCCLLVAIIITIVSIEKSLWITEHQKNIVLLPPSGWDFMAFAPSFAPVENRCQNDPTFLVEGEANGNCEWVAMRSRQRCKLKDMGGTKACPGACNLRCRCKNFRGKFRVELESTKCKNINNKTDCLKTAGTNGKVVADFCPRKCNNCYPWKIFLHMTSCKLLYHYIFQYWIIVRRHK